ncbi:MAG: hypothetical protein J5714_01485 [Alphaproteobacteria bacterium]|nr:hypothetical protein [Alphaproteobacteria bacterium]
MSHSSIIQRVPKTPDNRYGIKRVEFIPGDEVCVLYLGGNDTTTTRAANGNAKIIEQDILPDLSAQIQVYVAQYMVDTGDMAVEWESNFSKYGHNFLGSPRAYNSVWITKQNFKRIFNNDVLPRVVGRSGRPLSINSAKEKLDKLSLVFDGDFKALRSKMALELQATLMECGVNIADSKALIQIIINNSISAKDFDTQYIDELFENAILPRISDNGSKLPLDVAMSRARKINIVAHCHGAYVAQKLEEKTKDKMRELGYSPTETNQILSQVLVVAHAPVIPLGVSKFRIISFTTARDFFAQRPNNWVKKYVRYKQTKEKTIGTDWLQPCFLSGHNGDVFIIRNAFNSLENGRPSPGEHRSARYVAAEGQNDIGIFMSFIAGNILKNGIENSLKEKFTPLPPTSELVLGKKNREGMRGLFEQMQKNGTKFMADVYKFAKDVHKETHIKRPILKTPELKR